VPWSTEVRMIGSPTSRSRLAEAACLRDRQFAGVEHGERRISRRKHAWVKSVSAG